MDELIVRRPQQGSASTVSDARFVDWASGAEELIAELGAAFWCAQFRLEQAKRTETGKRTAATTIPCA